MDKRINGIVLSNDGELARVRMPDGSILYCRRLDPLIESVQTREQFFKDFMPGEVSPSFEPLRVN